MTRIRYSKTELKRQRDLLITYTRFLPILHLKKQQLQLELRNTDSGQEIVEKELHDSFVAFEKWADLLDASPDIPKLLRMKVDIIDRNVAGVRVPEMKAIEFTVDEYDLFETPPWVEIALNELKRMKRLKEELSIYKKQKEILSEELKVVNRRINLFEKVRIPRTEGIIRIIKIYLDEEQTATVIRGKKCKEILKRRGT